MEQVSIVGIDLAKRSFQVHGARAGRVGRVPQEGEPGEAARLSRFAAALRGGDGSLRECPLLGSGDLEARPQCEAGPAGLREAAEERYGGRGGDLRGGATSDHLKRQLHRMDAATAREEPPSRDRQSAVPHLALDHDPQPGLAPRPCSSRPSSRPLASPALCTRRPGWTLVGTTKGRGRYALTFSPWSDPCGRTGGALSTGEIMVLRQPLRPSITP